MLILETRRPRGAGFCRAAPLSHIDQSGCSRKNFAEILGLSHSRTRLPLHSGRIRAGQIPKISALPARHLYRLQIAEGVLKLLESYQYLERF